MLKIIKWSGNLYLIKFLFGIYMTISGAPLFSLPGNKRFVYFNTDVKIRKDPLLKSLNDLHLSFEKCNNFKGDIISNLEELRLFGSFGIPLAQNVDTKIEVPAKRNNFMSFLKDHVKEALQFGLDDGVSKFKSKNNFLVPNVKAWYETFKLFHNIFIENPQNPDYQIADSSYKTFVEHFDKLMDIDERFFTKCCENGIKKACNLFNNPVLSNYGKPFPKALINEAVSVYFDHARGPNIYKCEQKLIEDFELCWINEKKCDSLIFRTKSTMDKLNRKNSCGDSGKHFLASTCNCRRVQYNREYPYVISQKNYEFYKILPYICMFCVKKKLEFWN